MRVHRRPWKWGKRGDMTVGIGGEEGGGIESGVGGGEGWGYRGGCGGGGSGETRGAIVSPTCIPHKQTHA